MARTVSSTAFAIFVLTLVSFTSASSLLSSLDLTNLAVRNFTPTEVGVASNGLVDITDGAANWQKGDLFYCKETCGDFLMSYAACIYPEQTSTEAALCLCDKQLINTLSPCSECMVLYDHRPIYAEQTNVWLDLCDSLHDRLERNSTASQIFFDESPTPTSSPALATRTVSPSLTSSATANNGPSAGIDGGLSLSTDFLTRVEVRSAISEAQAPLSSSTVSARSTSAEKAGESGVPTNESRNSRDFESVSTLAFVALVALSILF